jgi:hypothetical protein
MMCAAAPLWGSGAGYDRPRLASKTGLAANAFSRDVPNQPEDMKTDCSDASNSAGTALAPKSLS